MYNIFLIVGNITNVDTGTTQEVSLSPERIGARPYPLCFLTRYCVWFHSFLLFYFFYFFFTTLLKCRSGAVLREVHRKTLLEALAEELPIDSIRLSSKLTSIRTQGQEGSSIALIDMEDGTTIRAKVTCH